MFALFNYTFWLRRIYSAIQKRDGV